jgi:hypothetical protein
METIVPSQKFPIALHYRVTGRAAPITIVCAGHDAQGNKAVPSRRLAVA